MEAVERYGLWGLFASAFVSSTLAPGGSEAVLAGLLASSSLSTSSLVVTATIGNSLGAMTTWLLGTLVSRGYSLRKFSSVLHLDPAAVDRVRRWGVPVLFFSWLPVVGDAFCFAAGWLRLSLLPSIVMIVAGKAVRYLFIALLMR